MTGSRPIQFLNVVALELLISENTLFPVKQISMSSWSARNFGIYVDAPPLPVVYHAGVKKSGFTQSSAAAPSVLYAAYSFSCTWLSM